MSRLLPMLSLVVAIALAPLPEAEAKKKSDDRWSSYTKPVANGKFVLVMLTEEDRSGVDSGKPPKTNRESGLYANGDPKRLLWTVDWYEKPHLVQVSSDGVHLVRRRRDALEFYANGKLLGRQPFSALADRRPEDKEWGEWLRSAKLDDAASVYRAETHDGNRFVFDLAGFIVEEVRPVRQLAAKKKLDFIEAYQSQQKQRSALVLLATLLAILGVAVAIWREWRKPAKRKPPVPQADAIRLP